MYVGQSLPRRPLPIRRSIWPRILSLSGALTATSSPRTESNSSSSRRCGPCHSTPGEFQAISGRRRSKFGRNRPGIGQNRPKLSRVHTKFGHTDVFSPSVREPRSSSAAWWRARGRSAQLEIRPPLPPAALVREQSGRHLWNHVCFLPQHCPSRWSLLPRRKQRWDTCAVHIYRVHDLPSLWCFNCHSWWVVLASSRLCCPACSCCCGLNASDTVSGISKYERGQLLHAQSQSSAHSYSH